jgi:hypothetical protein
MISSRYRNENAVSPVVGVMLMLVKPMLQKKKSTIQVVKSIKAFYYEVYKKNGLKKLEPWN